MLFMEKERLIAKIETAIDSIRPYLKTDGGDVRVVDVSEDFVVSIELLGSCGTCPMSPMTMKNGVEEAIKNVVPEITKVVALNSAELSI
jgi:Fe-S cluster biogenesis protein NfuA